MKKVSCIILLAALLLTACSRDPGTADSNPAATVAAKETHITEVLPLPQESMEFSFMSGAGAWRTVMTLARDGTFTGWYHDSEMGDVGEGYPHGSAYTSVFSGKFEGIEKIDEYSYKMTLMDLKTERAVGEEWIEDEIRYVASEPFGLIDSMNGQTVTEFIFYLPDTPVDQLSEDFLLWWPYQYSEEAKTVLSCYGILNVATGNGFFTAEQ